MYQDVGMLSLSPLESLEAILSSHHSQSAPRWDLEDPRISIPCVQSLYGHGGTVIALAHGFDVLLSSSTDGYLFVWRDSSPARLLRFPSYAVRQRIEPGHGKNKARRLRF